MLIGTKVVFFNNKKYKGDSHMNPVVISAIGVGVAVVFTVIAMFKGMKPLLAGPICALII